MMNKRKLLTLLGLVLIASLLAAGGGYFVSLADEGGYEQGVLRVWVSWGDDPAQLQALFELYSQASGQPVKVTTHVRSDKVMKALSGSTPPDVVILSSSDLVGSYYQQGLVEALDGWVESTGIDLEDLYPAPLAQCETPEGAYACLPWGGDVEALFWNKDLFEAAGLDPERPPQTMEQLVEYAGELTLRDESGELSQVGFIPDFPRSYADLYTRMIGGSFYNEAGTKLAVNSQEVIEALNWEARFYELYSPAEIKQFVASFTPYGTSRHPLYAGRRMSCQQCHRSGPIQEKKIPGLGFSEGRVAMMVAGEWQASLNALSQVNYGVAPFPPSSTHLERAHTTVVQGPVAVIPAGAPDKQAAARLLAWMMSPEIVADASYANFSLPASRTAAQDPRFRQVTNFELFVELMAGPNAGPIVTTPINEELNQALAEVEEQVLHEGEGDPAALLDEAQAGLADKLREMLVYLGGP